MIWILLLYVFPLLQIVPSILILHPSCLLLYPLKFYLFFSPGSDDCSKEKFNSIIFFWWFPTKVNASFRLHFFSLVCATFLQSFLLSLSSPGFRSVSLDSSPSHSRISIKKIEFQLTAFLSLLAIFFIFLNLCDIWRKYFFKRYKFVEFTNRPEWLTLEEAKNNGWKIWLLLMDVYSRISSFSLLPHPQHFLLLLCSLFFLSIFVIAECLIERQKKTSQFQVDIIFYKIYSDDE